MKTLLLADDSVTIQRVIELTFAHEDIRVVSVSDGRRALQWMENDSPDIVLVDVEVPDVDGYAVAAHVKESRRLKGVPVLLLAGAFEPVDHDRVRSIGCDGVLVKPFEPQQLVSRVKGLLHQASTAAAAAASNHDYDQAHRPHESDSGTVTPFPGGARAATAHHAAGASVANPEPLEPPTRPVWESSATTPMTVERLEPPAASRVSLANAFSALLAAEQSNNHAAPAASLAPAVSDAALEEAVHRVLARMTEDQVRNIVAETAERLVREEIEKIKAKSE